MRVLHLTTEFPPVIYGGLGTAVGGWVKASARAGIEVAVQLVEGPLVLGGVGTAYGSAQPPRHGQHGEVRVGDEGILFYTSSWEDAVEVGVRAIRAWRPDVVHLHTAMLWYLAEALQQRTGRPIVYHVHSVDRAEYELGQEPSPWLAHSQAQEQAMRAADRLIALAQGEAELIERYYPESRSKVRVVGNGIDDSDDARATAFARDDARAPLILYSGRLVERKGIRELLAALPQVLEAAPAARAVLAGGPPSLSGHQVAGQWLGPDHHPYVGRIHFTGWLSPEDVSRWYRRADILVVPSRYEPFGMVVLEGMLYGLPIVAAAVGGPAEILDQGRTGLLFPPGDVPALGAALMRLLEDLNQRRQIGQAAAIDVRRKWLWGRRVIEMRDVYDELLLTRARAA